jgi:large subunit ribosomal protein L28
LSISWHFKELRLSEFGGVVKHSGRFVNAKKVLALYFVDDIVCGPYFEAGLFMARICELTGKRPMKGSIIWRSGKSKKSGGIGTHVTAITKRRFMPNLQRVKAVIDGEVRYVRVAASAIKKGLVVKAPRRTWKKDAAKA